MNISLLKQLVSINSAFPHEKELGNFLFNYLQELGFTVQKQLVSTDRFNILAEKGDGDTTILFYGHIDTVPVQGEWQTDPFTLVEDDDKLYGLGTLDMKGGIFALLEAIKLSKSFKHKIKIAFCVDEENISLGAHALSSLDFIKDANLVISIDSAMGMLSTPDGHRSIVLGRRGRTALRITVPGSAGHGANEDPSKKNAILEAAKLIPEIIKLPLSKNSKLGNSKILIQNISSHTESLSIPELCTIDLSVFLVPPDSSQTVLAQIKNLIDDLYNKKVFEIVNQKKISVDLIARETPYLEPYLTDEQNPLVLDLFKQIETVYDHKMQINYGRSVADENVLAHALKTVPVITLGAEGKNEHSGNEWASKASLAKLIQAYQLII